MDLNDSSNLKYLIKVFTFSNRVVHRLFIPSVVTLIKKLLIEKGFKNNIIQSGLYKIENFVFETDLK